MPNQLIVEAFQNTDPEYLKTIEDRFETGGSQWIGGKIPWQILAILDWADYAIGAKFAYRRTNQQSCKYFRLASPLPLGYQSIKLLSEFEDLSGIQIVDGKHGTKELRTICPDLGAEITHEAVLILGSDKQTPDKLVVWTAYPGILTASLESIPYFDGTPESLEAVKVSEYPVAVKFFTSNAKRRTLKDLQRMLHTDKPPDLLE